MMSLVPPFHENFVWPTGVILRLFVECFPWSVEYICSSNYGLTQRPGSIDVVYCTRLPIQSALSLTIVNLNKNICVQCLVGNMDSRKSPVSGIDLNVSVCYICRGFSLTRTWRECNMASW